MLEGRYRLLVRALWRFVTRGGRVGGPWPSQEPVSRRVPPSRSQPGAGIAAAAVIAALPRLAGSKRALRFRLGRWLSPRTSSLYRATQAWAFVIGCWLVRGVAWFILLGTLGLGYSFPLALLFLCAGAAAAALPVGPAGAATQAGAGTAALVASGIGTSQELAASVSVGGLGVFCGAAVLLFAVAWRTVRLLVPARTAAQGDAPEVVDRVLGEEDVRPPPRAQRGGRTRARCRAASRA